MLGGVLNDLVLGDQTLFCQLIECAPARAVRRDGVGGDPFGVDVAVEILAGGDFGVEVADVEGLGGGWGGGCAAVCLFLSQAASVKARLTASANGLMCFMGENISQFLFVDALSLGCYSSA